MVVAHRGHLAVLVRRLDVGYLVRAGVARRTGGPLRELGEGARGEGREELRHRVPGAADERAVELVGAAGAGSAGGELGLEGHGGGAMRGR